MIKITQNDIQHIEDENALIRFLKEKLNIPIPDDLTIEDISSKYSNYALGLSGSNSKQVLDCQEISISPGQSSGIFLIRFNSEYGYDGILHAVTQGLKKRGLNPIDLRFICINDNNQPFALTYFKNIAKKEKQTAELNILVWKQDNTRIHIASVHDITDEFILDVSKNSNKIKGQLSTDALLEKIEKIGKPLSTFWEIHKGISKGSNKAFVVDETKRKELIREDSKSAEIIRLCIGKHQISLWKPILKHIIWIPSSRIKQWQWSDASNELEAKKIFDQAYPAISKHLHRFEIDIKKRNTSSKGQYYWEHSPPEDHPTFLGPKIILYDKPPILAFYDESDAIVVNPFVHSIQTTDLSLLAIFNSKFFQWYVQHKYKLKGGGRLNKTNLKQFPVAGTESQKMSISRLVKQILNKPDSPEVPDLEQEINQLVYELYELKPAEIAFITDSLNLISKSEKRGTSIGKQKIVSNASKDENRSQTENESMLVEKQNTEIPPESSESQSDFHTNSKVKSISSNSLSSKLDNKGRPLIEYAEMYGRPSIQPGCRDALVLNEDQREQLIDRDANNENLITHVVHMPRDSRWKPVRQHLIWISSSEFTRWPWSDAKSEKEAERIFSDTYPVLSQHIFKHNVKLKNAVPGGKGLFYWELPLDKAEQTFYPSKIIYPADGFSLNAAHDTSGSFILGNWTLYIPTTDLSLLAILNSKLFSLYAKSNFQAKYSYKKVVPKNWLTFKKAYMRNLPIADRTVKQKEDLSAYVELISDNPDSSDVPDLEEEINQLVYKLYELTPAEIKLIEEEANQ